MRTRRRKIKKGGDGIPGEQGCVIIPSLIADRFMKTRNTTKVTKIFFSDADFEQEKAKNDEVLAKVDPAGSYTAAAYTTTPINVNLLTPKEITQCGSKLKNVNLKTAKFLNYRYLGNSIDELIQKDVKIDAKTSQSMITAVSNLAIKILYLNEEKKLFHNDVHEGNIMFNPKEGHSYLIDFSRLSETPDGGNQLTDLQGVISSLRLFVEHVLGQKKLPAPLIEQLTSFQEDSRKMLVRASELDSKEGRALIVKFLSDFSYVYSTLVGGRRKKTLRRPRH